MDELLKRDQQREKDGFHKKIRFRRVMVGQGKIIMVPYVEEEKLIHGEFEPEDQLIGDMGDIPGSGEGEVGQVIAEAPLQGEDEGEGEDPNAGTEPGEHGIEEEAYRFGKELSEKFQLPNLKDKGKKIPTDEYIYDLTDRHRGSGQFLDKQETLKSIVETNVILGRVDKDNIDTTQMVVGPNDKVYRVLSREKVWKSQAVVFFLRDYSGSMWGEPTKAILAQHMMIYAWLIVQYEKMVIPRFIVHDTEAQEVSVEHYFKRTANGGTLIASGYGKINEIVEGEGLARNYNIYVFQGTDGDDWDDGTQSIPELEKMLSYVNRIGVCVLRHRFYGNNETPFEKYVGEGNILNRKDLFRMHVMSSTDITEEENIEAFKKLIAQD
ncbi:MAG: DUF444 family protein [Candidatus Nealsonbacteria bacterium]|nr:DUF444 family protein [Candidatus Nealsonbacteria bacterium]